MGYRHGSRACHSQDFGETLPLQSLQELSGPEHPRGHGGTGIGFQRENSRCDLELIAVSLFFSSAFQSAIFIRYATLVEASAFFSA